MTKFIFIPVRIALRKKELCNTFSSSNIKIVIGISIYIH